jgi:broad specificity phosphatase PhoE
MPPAREIWLVRHAETAWSVAKKHTGRTDVPLTEEGREAARRLRPRLGDREWATVWSSPLSRARETCELAGLGDRAVLRDELVEWDYGAYEGTTTAEIREARPQWFLWRDGCPDGEGPFDVGRRIDPLIDELIESEGDAVLFAHGHVLRVLAARWVGLPPVDGALLALSTGSVSVLGWEREVRVLWGWNR